MEKEFETMETTEKCLTKSGKKKLFAVLEKYIELKIINQISPANDELCDKLEEAEKQLEEIIDSLVWRIE